MTDRYDEKAREFLDGWGLADDIEHRKLIVAELAALLRATAQEQHKATILALLPRTQEAVRMGFLEPMADDQNNIHKAGILLGVRNLFRTIAAAPPPTGESNAD